MPLQGAVLSEMPFYPLPPAGHQPYYGSEIVSAVNISLDDPTGYADYGGFDPFFSETNAWKNKSVKSWSGNDIIHWTSSVARDLGVCPTEINGEWFGNYDGYQLSNLPESEFRMKDKNFGGILYRKLQEILDKEYGRVHYHPGIIKQEDPGSMDTGSTLTSLEDDGDSRSTDSEDEDDEEDMPPPPPPEKKGRGRPRLPRKKKKTEKLGRLWEFLRDLLKNPEYCPSLIVWENYEEGMFRFVHSDRVAKLWGSKKENPDMNYEKLSRAMRYYYKSKVLQPVYGRRLVYKFGPNATGWRVDNPNFVH